MNNLFKSNSRFAALAEDDNKGVVEKKKNEDKKKNDEKKKEENSRFNFNNVEEKKPNHFKSENRFEGNDRRRDDRFGSRRNDFKKQAPAAPAPIPEVVMPVLTADDFPTMGLSKNVEVKQPVISFAKKASENCNIGETIKFSSPVSKPVEKIITDEERIQRYKDQQYANEVLQALCNLHEKRTEMYIERYGYDAWERTFKFPGWEEEEEYNQQLDDEYERWLEREEEREIAEYEQQEREERLANNDRFVNYWKYY